MNREEFFYDSFTKYFVLQPQDELAWKRKDEYLKNVGFYKQQCNVKLPTGRLNEKTIKTSLANTPQVVFEVTERCNLVCKYCCYGEFYCGKSLTKERGVLPLVYATNFIDFINELFGQNLNRSLNRELFISFFGGEPLLNINLIKSIIEYIKELNNKNFNPLFSIATNGLLLIKHIDYLVENNFNIQISLDGDQGNNSYRVFPNGKDAFNEITKNVDHLFNNYPDFFKKHVSFNSVIHNRNSVSEAFNYIYKKYGKNTRISEVNTSGVNEKRKEEFWKIYKNATEDLNQSEDYRFICDTLFMGAPNIKSLSNFIHTYTNNVYPKYIDFFNNRLNKSKRSGTCNPFSQKVFITTKGHIHPCEIVSDKFSKMGYINNNGVVINYENVVNFMNGIFDKLQDNCNQCFYATRCAQCIFNLDLKNEKLVCHGYKHEDCSTQIISNHLKLLKSERKYYKKILK